MDFYSIPGFEVVEPKETVKIAVPAQAVGKVGFRRGCLHTFPLGLKYHHAVLRTAGGNGSIVVRVAMPASVMAVAGIVFAFDDVMIADARCFAAGMVVMRHKKYNLHDHADQQQRLNYLIISDTVHFSNKYINNLKI